MNAIALKQILQQQTAPCFLVQGDSHEILLCNQRMSHILRNRFSQEDYVGQIFYHVIQEEQAPKNFNPLADWDGTETRAYEIYAPQDFHHPMTVSLIPLKLQGDLYILCRYVPCHQKTEVEPYTSEEALIRTFQILKEEQYRFSFLQVLSSFYHSELACFFRVDPKAGKITCIHGVAEGKETEELLLPPEYIHLFFHCMKKIREENPEDSFLREKTTFGNMDHVTGVLYNIISVDCRDSKLLEELYQVTGQALGETPWGGLLQVFQPCFPKQPLTNLFLSLSQYPQEDSFDLVVLFQCQKENSEFYNLLYTATRFMSIEKMLRGSKRRLEQLNKSDEVGQKPLEKRKEILAWLEQIQLSKKLAMDETQAWLDLVQSNQSSHSETGFLSSDTFHKHCQQWRKEPPRTFGLLLISINEESHGEKDYELVSQILKEFHHGDWFSPHSDFNPYSDYCYDACDYVTVFLHEDKKNFEERILRFFQSLHHFKKMPFTMGYAFGKGRYSLDELFSEAEEILFINKQGFLAHYPWELIEDVDLSRLLYELETREFEIFLQPQMYLEDGSIHGAEALIRRKDRTVFPDQFVPFYEERSIIRHIDLFVVEKVCSLLAEWGKDYEPVQISVNLSRVTLTELGIVDTLCEICDRHQVPHELLVIEVTERMGLVENNVASVLIDEFKAKGFLLSLDDFGCAYSNLVTLSQISVDEVKMDKSLVDYIEVNSKAQVMMKNILSMCHELAGTITLVEGIENEAQAQLLREYHCQLGQGYHFSRPISTHVFFQTYIKSRKKT